MSYYQVHSTGTHLRFEEREFLYFGGTSYLGMQTDPVFQELLIQNIRRYGTQLGSSRHSNVRLQLYEEAEAYLAHWVGSPACLTLSSGFLAARLAASLFRSPPYTLFCTPNTHPALKQPGCLESKDYAELKKNLDFLLKEGSSVPVLLMDTIDFSGLSSPDYKDLRSLPLESLILLADDSHGMGITGPEGSGAWSLLQALNPRELVVCCSLGKALGIQGGAVFGSKDRIAGLFSTESFGGASPAAPAFLAAMMQAGHVYQSKGRLLKQNIAFFLQALEQAGRFSYMPEYPVFSYTDPGITRYLYSQGFIPTDFRYPSESSRTASRIVLSAAHTEAEIGQLAELLNRY